jgi:putative hydrolase of the HAD superfamily
MTTVLVHSDYQDHPAQQQMKKWRGLPDHIHHATDDLTAFLATLAPKPNS